MLMGWVWLLGKNIFITVTNGTYVIKEFKTQEMLIGWHFFLRNDRYFTGTNCTEQVGRRPAIEITEQSLPLIKKKVD